MKARDERDKLLPPVREVELRPAEETTQAIQPVLVPETPEEEPEIIYAPILSGVGSNKLALISTRIKPDIDTEAETATYMQSGLSLIIGDYGSITEGFRVSTQKLYDMLVLKLTNQNHYGKLEQAGNDPLRRYSVSTGSIAYRGFQKADTEDLQGGLGNSLQRLSGV